MTTGRWGSYARNTQGRFVDKKDWAEREVPFYITKIEVEGARSSGGKDFDEQWILTVRAEDEPGTTISFGRGSGGRDEALEAAANDLDDGKVSEIGPLMIVKVRTKRGNPFYALEAAEEDGDGFGDFDQNKPQEDNTVKQMTRLPNQVDDLPF